MPERPIFIPVPDGPELVKEVFFSIAWHPGFAASQKKKNIRALHDAAATAGYSPLLEISTKSDEKLGRHLSAFHLKVRISRSGEIPLECAFQGSKVFEGGGPYTDLYSGTAATAKRDPRLENSGRLVGFKLQSFSFPLLPRTAFYDWLYLNAIYPHREWLTKLNRFAGFTDIEFNPARSINCQARTCALFVALLAKNLLEAAVSSPSTFIKLLSAHTYRPDQREQAVQSGLFAK